MRANSMLLTAILSFTFFSLFAQVKDTVAVHTFSLEECIKYANEHQTNILNADLDRKIAQAKVKETIGIGLPQVSGKADFTDYLKSPVILFPDFIGPAIYGAIENNVRDANGNPLTVTRPAGVGGFQEV